MEVRLRPGTALSAARGRALQALAYPAFRRLWLAAVTEAFSNWMERLAVGWLVLDLTDSVFLAALSFAVRAAPNMVLGPFGGAVADRFDRRRVLVAGAVVRAGTAVGIAVLVLVGVTAVWPILVLVALRGAVHTTAVPATQTLIVDIVGRRAATNAIGLHSVGQRAIGVLGALGGGLVIEAAGAGVVFLIAGALLLLAAVLYAAVRVERPPSDVPRGASLWADAMEGLRTIARIPVVPVLLALAVLVEIFAFSYQSLLPAVADRILDVGAVGLGALTFAGGVGAVVGAGVLSISNEGMRGGRMLVGVTAGFGALLLAFAASDVFVLSLVLIAGIGAMAAMFDALQWVLLQSAVPDEMRGRVIGGWMAAIGFGWLGPVLAGALAEATTTPLALAASGALVVLLAGGAAASGVRRL